MTQSGEELVAQAEQWWRMANATGTADYGWPGDTRFYGNGLNVDGSNSVGAMVLSVIDHVNAGNNADAVSVLEALHRACSTKPDTDYS